MVKLASLFKMCLSLNEFLGIGFLTSTQSLITLAFITKPGLVCVSIFVQWHSKPEQDNLCFDFGAVYCASGLCGDPEEIVYCEKYFESPRDSLDVTVCGQIMTLTCCGKGKEV